MKKIRTVLVAIGWVVVFSALCVVATPLVYSFTNNETGLVPISSALPCVLILLSVVIPVFYAAAGLITPLIYATMELFDNDVD